MSFDKTFFDDNIKKEIKLLLLNSSSKIELFEQLINDNKYKYISMDFEFKTEKNVSGTRELALIQLCIYFKEYYLIIFFDVLDAKQIDIFKNIICKKDIYKIMHGTEALDIKFIYKNILLIYENIIKFNCNFIDTKIYCNYLRKKKCNIYDLLREVEVINMKTYNFLIENEKKFGGITNVKININEMNEEIINYCLYDVIYLKKLYLKLRKRVTDRIFIRQLYKYSILENLKITNVHKYYENFIKKFSLSTIKEKKIKFYKQFNKDIKKYNYLTIEYTKKHFYNLLKIIAFDAYTQKYFKKKFTNLTFLKKTLKKFKFTTILKFINNFFPS